VLKTKRAGKESVSNIKSYLQLLMVESRCYHPSTFAPTFSF